MTCQEYEMLLALYVEGDVSADEAACVATHIQECTHCQTLLEELRESQAVWKRVLAHMPPEDALMRVRSGVLRRIAGTDAPAIPTRRSPLRSEIRWHHMALAVLIFGIGVIGYIMYRHPGTLPRDVVRRPPTGGATVSETSESATSAHESAPQVAPAETPADTRPASPPSAPSVSPPRTAAFSLSSSSRKNRYVLRGQVVDPEGHPLPGVTITVFPENTPEDIQTVITDRRGRFMVRGAAGDPVIVLRASLEGFRPQLRYIPVTSVPQRDVIVQLAPRLGAKIVPVSVGALPKSTPPRYKLAREPEREVPTVTSGAPPGGPAPSVTVSGSSEETSARALTDTLSLEDPLVIVVAPESRTTRSRDAVPLLQPVRRSNTGNMAGKFPLQHVRVRTEISGIVAETEVEQVFANPFDHPIEAVYTFPLPDSAAITDFEMRMGDRHIVGIVRPREEAERLYREARARGYPVSLMTQERPNVFTQHVANIVPGQPVAVRIRYFERMHTGDDSWTYVFPTVVGPRSIPGQPRRPFQQTVREPGGGWSPPTDTVPDADRITPPVTAPGTDSGHHLDLTVDLRTDLPIADVRVPTHRVRIRQHSASHYTVQLDPADRRMNRDFILQWRLRGDRTRFGVITHRSDTEGYILLLLHPPEQPPPPQVVPRELTFILDTSGSMHGRPLEIAITMLERALDRMRPEDAFNIVVFSRNSTQLWERPQPATETHIAEARRFLHQLHSGGGTRMLYGLHRALQMPPLPNHVRMFVLLSDGLVGNETNILQYIRDHRRTARFFAFGIGSSVNRYLIAGIARYGGGRSYIVVPRDRSHVAKAVDMLYRAIDTPVLTDVRIDWNDLPVADVYPKVIPDLFTGQTVAVIARYVRPKTGLVTIRARRGEQDVVFDVPVRLPESQPRYRALRILWARQRIADLEDALAGLEDPEQREARIREITRLAVRYRLVTPFTAFLAVDASRVVGDGLPARIVQPVEPPEDLSYAGVFGESGYRTLGRVQIWGTILGPDTRGRIRVVHRDPDGPVAHAGIPDGAILQRVGRTVPHDLVHLEGLLLQLPGKHIAVTFEPGGTVTLPLPH